MPSDGPSSHAGPAADVVVPSASSMVRPASVPTVALTGATAVVRAPVVEPVRRGGVQVIPRPDRWRPGGRPPWASLPAEGRRLTTAAVAEAIVRAPEPRRSPLAAGDDGPASAVLAALYDDGGEAHVVLTRRAQHLRAHRGEVSFPGGRRDPGEDLRITALREAQEEVGLDPSRVEIVGQLDHLQTVAGNTFIVPWVGILPGRPELVPSPHEVERIIHVPLSELLDERVYHAERWGVPPAERELSFFDLVGDTVWGATASMLRNLLCVATGTAPDLGAPGVE